MNNEVLGVQNLTIGGADEIKKIPHPGAEQDFKRRTAKGKGLTGSLRELLKRELRQRVLPGLFHATNESGAFLRVDAQRFMFVISGI